MTMAETTNEHSGDRNQSIESTLFQGKWFWLSQNVPSRRWFREMIQRHGGFVTVLEKNADIKLVDYTRKNLPTDSYSYRFVEQSVINGKLENLEDHKIGHRAPRPVGATSIPRRTHRLYFTLEEDQMLWDYMQPYEKARVSCVSGVRIYQVIAEKYPRHTYQSWRDRYLKRLRGRPRPGLPVPDVTGQGQPSTSTRIDENPPTPRRGTIERPSSHTSLPRTVDGMVQRDTELATTDRQEDRKRKRSTADNDPSESFPSSNEAGPSQKRRAVRPASETVVPSSSHLPDREIPESPQRTPNTTNHTIDLGERRHPTQKEKDPATEPDDDLGMLLMELPFFPSSPEPEDVETESESEKDIDTWIDTRLRTGKAKNVVQVIEALRCTSMEPRLADQVLEHLVAGKGIPNNIPGVWTPEDDKSIEGTESRDIERVLKKHGREFFNARWEYLSLARTAGLEEN